MDVDLIDLYSRASRWTLGKVAGATEQLDADTGCDGWDVRALMNHMLDTGNYFVGAARGEDVSPPTRAARQRPTRRTTSRNPPSSPMPALAWVGMIGKNLAVATAARRSSMTVSSSICSPFR